MYWQIALRLNEEISEQEEQTENIDRFISKVRKYLDLDELTPAALNQSHVGEYALFQDNGADKMSRANLFPLEP